MADAINIILGNIDDQFQEFVEIEDDDGKSVGIGTYREDGPFRKLRITVEDIKKLQCDGDLKSDECIADCVHCDDTGCPGDDRFQ